MRKVKNEHKKQVIRNERINEIAYLRVSATYNIGYQTGRLNAMAELTRRVHVIKCVRINGNRVGEKYFFLLALAKRCFELHMVFAT